MTPDRSTRPPPGRRAPPTPARSPTPRPRTTPSGSGCSPTRPGSGCCTCCPPRPSGALRVGDLARQLGISQSTCSHHVELLRKVGFVVVDKVGNASMVSVNAACCTGLPHAADVIMGTLSSQPCCPTDLPVDVTVRPVTDADLEAVLAIYAEGTRDPQRDLRDRAARRPTSCGPGGCRTWPGSPSSTAPSSAGPRSMPDVDPRVLRRGRRDLGLRRGVRARPRRRQALLHTQVNAADAAGMWTLQTSIFPENRASLALHRSAGYRTLAVRTPDRAARRRLARHGAPRAAQRARLSGAVSRRERARPRSARTRRRTWRCEPRSNGPTAPRTATRAALGSPTRRPSTSWISC